MSEDAFVTLIGFHLCFEIGCYSLSTIKIQNGKIRLVRMGISNKRYDKNCPDREFWSESFDKWISNIDNPKQLKHYVCIERLPKWSVWDVDEQEIRDVASIKRIITFHAQKHPNHCIRSIPYWKNEWYIDPIRTFVDQKEIEYGILTNKIKV